MNFHTYRMKYLDLRLCKEKSWGCFSLSQYVRPVMLFNFRVKSLWTGSSICTYIYVCVCVRVSFVRLGFHAWQWSSKLGISSVFQDALDLLSGRFESSISSCFPLLAACSVWWTGRGLSIPSTEYNLSLGLHLSVLKILLFSSGYLQMAGSRLVDLHLKLYGVLTPLPEKYITFLIAALMPLITIRNNRGPATVSCGTPLVTGDSLDWEPLMITYDLLGNHASIFPLFYWF